MRESTVLNVQTFGLEPFAKHNMAEVYTGERATLVCTGGEIYTGLASLMPELVDIMPLVSNGGQHVYRVVTHDSFTVAQFVEIIKKLANGEFEDVHNLLDELTSDD